jgi:hypothetical protein
MVYHGDSLTQAELDAMAAPVQTALPAGFITAPAAPLTTAPVKGSGGFNLSSLTKNPLALAGIALAAYLLFVK